MTICNAGRLNILGTAAIDGKSARAWSSSQATEDIRALIVAGQSERSMIGGADIREMAKFDQSSAEKFIANFATLMEAVRIFPAPVIARIPAIWCLVFWPGIRGGLRFPGRGP